jgi:hypothetical protein
MKKPKKNTQPNASIFPTIMVPLIRRVYPNLISNKLVTVQPMAAPSGGINYFNVVYDEWATLNKLKELPEVLQEKMKDHVIICVSQLTIKELMKIINSEDYIVKCVPKDLIDFKDSGYELNGIEMHLVNKIMIMLGDEIIIMQKKPINPKEAWGF